MVLATAHSSWSGNSKGNGAKLCHLGGRQGATAKNCRGKVPVARLGKPMRGVLQPWNMLLRVPVQAPP